MAGLTFSLVLRNVRAVLVRRDPGGSTPCSAKCANRFTSTKVNVPEGMKTSIRMNAIGSIIRWATKYSYVARYDWKMQARFILAVIRHPRLASWLDTVEASSPFGRLLAEDEATALYLVCPYQCAAWKPVERLRRIALHAAAVDKLGLWIAPGEKLLVADLSILSDDVAIMIDRPAWLTREGHLTISIFKGDFRAFSLTFSIVDLEERSIFIGGLQGRNRPNVLELYKQLTKDFHGVRPKDLIVEMLRFLADTVGIERIYAVSESCRIAHHSYFAQVETPLAHLNYDQSWEERGGRRVDDTCYELPVTQQRRCLADIPSKKRQMYRKRYEMLDTVRSMLPPEWASAKRLKFEAS